MTVLGGTPPTAGARAGTAAQWLTLATALVIVYGSLFPFDFAELGSSGPRELVTSLSFEPTSRGDIVSNLLLYMPLGLCLVLGLPTRWPRLAALVCALAAGTLLSVGIELLQVHVGFRVSSLTDVVINAVGTLVGGVAAIVFLQMGSEVRIPGAVTTRPDVAPLGVLLLWLAFRLAPFVPTIDWQKYKDAVKPLVIDPRIGAMDTFRYVAGWLVVGYAVRLLWRRAYAQTAFLVIAAIVLAGRIIVVGKVLSAAEILALALCLPLLPMFSRVSDRRQAALVAALVVVTIVLQGLLPFELAARPRPFSWVPFRSALRGNVELSYSALLEKAFWCFSLVWLLTRVGASVAGATAATAVLLGAIELAQVWLPGRSAEITDPLLAIAAGVLLALAAQKSLAAAADASGR